MHRPIFELMGRHDMNVESLGGTRFYIFRRRTDGECERGYTEHTNISENAKPPVVVVGTHLGFAKTNCQ